ncbi:MAG: cytochrome c/c1 heme lyase-domain-containing protein, partial [Podila humilis]
MTAQESPKDDAPKCPVDHSTFKHFLPKDAMPEGHPPVPTMTSDGEPAKCPVSPEAHKHFMPRNTTTSQPSDTPSSSTSSPASSSSSSSSSSTLKIDPTNNMPASPDQFRIASQTRDLNTEREISTIPKAANAADPYGEKGSSSGNHAADPDGDSDSVWIYPSEQMFFNAMKRKN